MAYSKRARALRRCTYHYPEGHEREGERCRAYALWDSDWRDGKGLCHAHTTQGERRGPNSYERPSWQRYTRTVAVCRCRAYNWPHRPGGGCCRWPEEPLYQSTIPEGTHAPYWRRRPEGLRWGPIPTSRRTFHVAVSTVEAS